MWDFFQTVRNRHSVRRYMDREVEREKIHAILETACSAPSAGDLQSYRVVVITEPEVKEGLREATDGQSFVSEAPVCLAFCADPARAESKYGERGRNLYALQDATIAAAYAQLAAVAAGLASTWVGFFDEQQVGRSLGLESGLQPIALLSIGYPAELPEPTPRRHLDEVVSWR